MFQVQRAGKRMQPIVQPVMQPILEMRGITKTFPGVNALKDVELTVYPGEIHAVVGENGALCGYSRPFARSGAAAYTREGGLKPATGQLSTTHCPAEFGGFLCYFDPSLWR